MTLVRAVVDTNILIRALIKPQGSVGAVTAALRARSFDLVLSWPLVEELSAKIALPGIRDKYHLSEQDITDYAAFLLLRGRLVEPTQAVTACRDSKDNMVLEAAVACRAQFIVIGHGDLLVLDPYQGIRIVPVAPFLRGLDRKVKPPAH